MDELSITTTEMHTGGEPVRIIESGYPEILGDSILKKRRFVRENFDQLRKFLMHEPRGHYDMYGVIPVNPDIPEANFAVLFMHNEGYSTMCGHAVISLGRYIVDKGLIKEPASPETEVNIQCPCGMVKAFVEYSDRKTGNVRFHSVPAYVYAPDMRANIPGYGEIKFDIAYGGAFYAFVPADILGLNLKKSTVAELMKVAGDITDELRKSVEISHPSDPDLAFLYGTILIDDRYDKVDEPTTNICVFAERQVDRSPCGSGAIASLALQHHRKYIKLGETRCIESRPTGSKFMCKAVKETKYGGYDAVIVEISGRGYYTGSCKFSLEDGDQIGKGFIVK